MSQTTATGTRNPADQRVGGFPHWLRDIDSTLPVTAQYIVHGNIRDRHRLPPVAGGQHQRLPNTVGALWACLEMSGYELLLHHSPVHGLQVWPPGDPAAATKAETMLANTRVTLGTATSHEQLAAVLQTLANYPSVRAALVIDYLSQTQPEGETPSEDFHRLMLAALAQVHAGHGFRHEGRRSSALYNPSFWLVDRPSDLPAWMVSGSDGIRQVPIPLPDLGLRRDVARGLVPSLPGAPAPAELVTQGTDGVPVDHPVTVAFARSTEGMTVRGMTEVVQLAIDAQVPAAQVEDSVRAYRLGLLENPWKNPYLREVILRGETFLNRQVLGQQRAVKHAVDVLTRSTMALTSAHQPGTPSGPRGVMFFAGPTGVGKTELAKAITRLIFGDERAYVRFDMSEFVSEHAEARLIGAPPGFVGHGSGGELTNAVRQRPFSLLLFDEIEKAHPRILDKFLQILSDGRLTDGSGGTVHFSESVIVFTSNLGIRGVTPQGESAADRAVSFRSQVKEAIAREFEEELNRPELLGRIGDNIVIFDHMSPEIAAELTRQLLGNVQARVRAEHQMELIIPAEVENYLVGLCIRDLSKGGRGVGLTLESCLTNPMGRELIKLAGRDRATVTRAYLDADGEHAVELR